MKFRLPSSLSALAMCLLMAGAWAQTADAQRKECIDADWRFLYGNGSAAIQLPASTAGWRTLTLPHDWSVEPDAALAAGGRVVGPFSTNSIGKFQTGNTVGGEGWYARTLRLTASDLQGRVSLYFEGAYNQAWVYVNGRLCHNNVYGYSSFRTDVTAQLHEGENAVLVRVVNAGSNSRWYAGSGIYRHVWLLRTPLLYTDEWDTFVRADDSGKVQVSSVVTNAGTAARGGRFEVEVRAADGSVAGTASSAFEPVKGGAQRAVDVALNIPGAQLWSPDTPNLYDAVVRVRDAEGAIVDEYVKRFGFRTLAFSATEGFLLNGQPTLLRGGCVHHDNGLLGAAAFDEAERRKLKLLKAQGFNAVRCSHNLPSENFLDVCDELGLMVIDECFDQWLLQKNTDDYHNHFATHSDDDIATMVRRDRNHPSIVMWSIGNEIPGRVEPAGIAAAARLRADVLELDTTRPITAAICGWDAGDAWNSAGGNWDIQSDNAFHSLDVGGYNYLFDRYEYDHQRHPDRVMCGLESLPKQASENWNLVERLPYVIGDFTWTAVDYLGEAGIGCAYADRQPSMFQDWPWFNAYCGDIDLIGQKKPQSYYRDVVWRQKPVTMAVQPTASHNNAWGWQLEEQSWTFPGREGQVVSVNVYSRAAKVRLYLNGKVVGEGVPGNTYWAGFSIAYTPGTLRVVNLDRNGRELPDEAFELTTTGTPVGVRMVYEDEQLSAQLNDLAFVTLELVDAEGRVVTSDCSTRLAISNTGCGELIACGTASPTDMQSFRSNTVTVFRGRALAIVRSNGQAGRVSLSAEMKEPATTFSYFFRNADFGLENLDSWTVSDNKYLRYNTGRWHESELEGFLECFTGWGDATTLAGQSFAQCTKVQPAGTYTLTFVYNGTFRRGTDRYQTNGKLTGVTVTAGGEQLALTDIGADAAQQATLRFTLTEPKAMAFMVQFAAGTNADWFAFDRLSVEYEGPFDFEHDYTDKSAAVPPFGGDNWKRVAGNDAASYVETKLASALYDQSGLAYWSASAPANKDLFSQDIKSLPAGKYGIAAFVAANRWSSSDNDRDPQRGTFLYASTSSGARVQAEVTTATYGLYSLVIDVNEGETLTIGLHAAANNGNNWCYLSPATLVRLGGTATGIGNTTWTGPALGTETFYDLQGRPAHISLASAGTPGGIFIAKGRKTFIH